MNISVHAARVFSGEMIHRFLHIAGERAESLAVLS